MTYRELVPANVENPELLYEDRLIAVLGCRIVAMNGRQTKLEDFAPADVYDDDEHGLMINGAIRALAAASIRGGPDSMAVRGKRGFEYPRRIECATEFLFTGAVTKPLNAPLTVHTPSEARVGHALFEARSRELVDLQPVYAERLGRITAVHGQPRCYFEETSTDTWSGLKAVVDFTVAHDKDSTLIITTEEHVARVRSMLVRVLHGRGMLADLSHAYSVEGANAYASSWDSGRQMLPRLAAGAGMDDDTSRRKARLSRLRHERLGVLAIGLNCYGEFTDDEPLVTQIDARFNDRADLLYDLLYSILRHTELGSWAEDTIVFMNDGDVDRQAKTKRWRLELLECVVDFWQYFHAVTSKTGDADMPPLWYTERTGQAELAAATFIDLWNHGLDKPETFKLPQGIELVRISRDISRGLY